VPYSGTVHLAGFRSTPTWLPFDTTVA
jgi:hypothetical protein